MFRQESAFVSKANLNIWVNRLRRSIHSALSSRHVANPSQSDSDAELGVSLKNGASVWDSLMASSFATLGILFCRKILLLVRAARAARSRFRTVIGPSNYISQPNLNRCHHRSCKGCQLYLELPVVLCTSREFQTDHRQIEGNLFQRPILQEQTLSKLELLLLG